MLNDCLSLFSQGGVFWLNPPLAGRHLHQHAFPGPTRTQQQQHPGVTLWLRLPLSRECSRGTRAISPSLYKSPSGSPLSFFCSGSEGASAPSSTPTSHMSPVAGCDFVVTLGFKPSRLPSLNYYTHSHG